MKIHGYIYLITNLVNGKQYVGQTTRSIKERWLEHCNNAKNNKKPCMLLVKAIQKYGKENFKIEEIAVAYNQEQLNFSEGFYINSFKTLVPNGYNLTNIIDGRGKLSEETKEKMRVASTSFKKQKQLADLHDKNRGKRKENSASKYVGVYLIKNGYVSNICLNSKTVYLGLYNEELDAARAYDIEAIKLFGQDCVLNFPELREDYLNNKIEINKKQKLYQAPKNITYEKRTQRWMVRINGFQVKRFKNLNDAILYKDLCQQH